MNENFTAIQARDCTLIIQDRQAHTQRYKESLTDKRTNAQTNKETHTETGKLLHSGLIEDMGKWPLVRDDCYGKV